MEKLLHYRVIDACQDIPACKQACFTPSNNLAGLFNELRKAIAIFEPSKEESNTLFTDCRYYRQLSTSRSPSRVLTLWPNLHNRKEKAHAELYKKQVSIKKQCFVCGKEGCWSNRHSQVEQEESQWQYGKELIKYYKNNTRQYIIEYEGTEQEDEYNSESNEEFTGEIAQTFIVDTNPPPAQPKEQTELFLTFLRLISSDTATNITEDLMKHLLIHAIANTSLPTTISENPFLTHHTTSFTTPEDPSTTPKVTTDYTISETPQPDLRVYVTAARYSTDRFYGVVIDTRASQKSTAGYGQVLAYQKSYPVTIDIAKARMVKVQFGIGTASLIGLITINTPIGSVEFHIVRADTPFLLCLTDMDALRVYYNNLENTLITPNGPIPVVWCFGHPFLL
jgi:hypothetical protein